MDLDLDSISVAVDTTKQFIYEREGWEYEEYGTDRDAKLIKKFNIESTKIIPNIKKYLQEPINQARNLDDSFVNILNSIQFRFQTQGQTVIFFRKFTRQKILSHGKGTWKAVSGTLRVNKDNIVEIPNDYDCCKFKDEMLIFHPDNFEDLFDYHEIHAEFHKEIFNYLEKKTDYTIENFDKIKEQTLNHPQKLRKLPAIKEKGMYLWSFKQIEDFLKRRPTPTISINPKKKTIVFKDVYAMIHFYNDSHLDSKATYSKYLVQNKSVEK